MKSTGESPVYFYGKIIRNGTTAKTNQAENALHNFPAHRDSSLPIIFSFFISIYCKHHTLNQCWHQPCRHHSNTGNIRAMKIIHLRHRRKNSMFTRSLIFGSTLLALLTYGFLNGLTLSQVINPQSIAIVFGGIAVVIWVGFPADRVIACINALIKSIRMKTTPEEDTRALLPQVLELARIYRLKGPLALEKAISGVSNEYLKFGASLIAEGYDRWSLVSALERESIIARGERKAQIQLLTTLTRLAPALGMAGTVVSLMHVMQDLGTVDQLGPSMGLALSSTLYGILLANLCFLPLASKLEDLARRETYEHSMLTEALLGLQQAMHPLRIAEKLNAYDIYCQMKKADQQADKSHEAWSNAPAARVGQAVS